MQQRHKDRRLYFKELANTSREFYIDYVEKWSSLGTNTKVLEIGCGEGGNLLPFAEKGCQVMGIDISQSQIKKASQFFKENNQTGKFIASDFLLVPKPESEEDMFDIILVHDVIEHIEAPHKMSFLQHMKHFMHHDAIAFFAFPAWQMPFGGHQQICSHAMSKIPYIHLLPTRAYLFLLSKTGEPESTIKELTSIKRSRMTIERFEKTVKKTEMHVVHRTLWIINPHYHQKFGLKPLREIRPFTSIRHLRNFYTTSAWYILKKQVHPQQQGKQPAGSPPSNRSSHCTE